MKQVVCREDIKAEMQILSNMQYDLQLLQSQVSLLQDRLELLEAKTSVINSMNTAVNVPTRTGDTTYGQSITDIADIRRAAAEEWLTHDDGADVIWNIIPNSNNN